MAQADGSVVIRTELDDSGLEEGFSRLKTRLKSVTNIAKKFGKLFNNQFTKKISTGLKEVSKGILQTQLGFNKFGSRSLLSRFKKTSSGVNGITSALKKLAAIALTAFATKSLIDFGKSCIEIGSDLAEVQNVVDQAFATMSGSVDDFATNAIKNAGLSELVAKQYIGTFGIMAKSMGFAESQAYEMSSALTQLTGDVASFYNLESEDAFNKIKSVFTGESESLKTLGVIMTQATLDQYALAKGYGKTTSQMTESEKVALRYAFVMDRLSSASGDFVRTQDGWANQTRILKLQFQSLKAQIGQGLIAALSPVVKLLNALIERLMVFAKLFNQFSQSLFGKQNSSSGSGLAQATEDTENLAGATEDVADATENAEKASKSYLAGLDEIKKLSDDDLGIDDVEAEVPQLNVDDVNLDMDSMDEAIDGLNDKFQKIIDTFVNAWNKAQDYILDRIQYVGKQWKKVLKDVGKTIYKVWTDGTGEKYVLSVLVLFGSLLDVIGSIGEALDKAWRSGSGESLVKNLISMFTDVNNAVAKVGRTIADTFRTDYGTNLVQSYLDRWSMVLSVIDQIAISFSKAWSLSGLDVVQTFFYWITECNKAVIEMGNAFKRAWNGENRGVKFFDDINKSATNLFGLLGDIKRDLAEVWKQPEGAEFWEHIIGIVDNCILSVGNLIGSIRNAWNETGLGKLIWTDIFNLENSALGPLESLTQKTAEWASKLDFTPILTSIHNLLVACEPLTKSVFEGLEWAWTNVLLPIVSWVFEDALPRFIDLLASVLNALNSVLEAIKPALSWFWDSFVVPLAQFTGFVITGAITALTEALNGIADWVSGKGQTTIGWLNDFMSYWQKIGNAVQKIWDENIGPLFERLMEGLKDIVENHIAPMLSKLTPLFEAVGRFYNEVIGPLCAFLIERLGPALEIIAKIAGTLCGGAFKMLCDFIGGVLDALTGLINFITDVFTGNWERAWQDITDIFKGWFGGIINVMKDMIEVIIGIFSDLFDTISGIFGGIGSFFGDIGSNIGNFFNSINPFSSIQSGFKVPVAFVSDGGVTPLAQTANSAPIATLAAPRSSASSGMSGGSGGFNLKSAISGAMSDAEMFRKKWDEVDKLIRTLWQKLLNSQDEMFKRMTLNVQTELGNTLKAVQSCWQGINDSTRNVFNTVTQTVRDCLSGMNGTVAQMATQTATSLETGWKLLVEVTKAAFDAVSALIESMTKSVQAFLKEYSKNWGELEKECKTVFNSIAGKVAKSWSEIYDSSEKYWSKTDSYLNTTWNGIYKNLSSIWEKIKSEAENKFKNASNSISTSTGQLEKNLGSKWNSIKGTVGNAVSGLCQNVISQFSKLSTNASSAWSSISNAVQTAISNIIRSVSAISQVANSMSSAWTNCATVTVNAWQNIFNSIQRVVNNVNNLITAWNVSSIFVNLWQNCITITTNAWVEINNAIYRQMVNIQNNMNIFANNIANSIRSINSLMGSVSTSRTVSSSSKKRYSLPSGAAIPLNSAVLDGVPFLAQGAVIPANAPFMAVLGDQKNGKNIEAPEKLIRDIIQDELQKANLNSGIKEIRIPLILNGKQLLEAIVSEAKLRQLATGRNAFSF